MVRRLTVLGLWVGLMTLFVGLDITCWQARPVTSAIVLTGFLFIVSVICTRLLWELAYGEL